MQEMIDLNEFPDDLNCDLTPNVVVENVEPMYCTQPSTQKAPPLNNIHEFVAEPPNPPTTQNVADPGMQAMHTEEHTLDDTDTLGATGVCSSVCIACMAGSATFYVVGGFGESDMNSWTLFSGGAFCVEGCVQYMGSMLSTPTLAGKSQLRSSGNSLRSIISCIIGK